MSFKKLAVEQVFILPAELDPAPDPERPMTWTVKALGGGATRHLDDLMINRSEYVSAKTAAAWSAWLSFGGSTFTREADDDGKTEKLFRPKPTLDEFLSIWDVLPNEVCGWIVERVWEVNPHMRAYVIGSSPETSTQAGSV